MNYLQIEFKTSTEDEREILLALLADAGFESFEETDNSLRAFVREADFVEEILHEICNIVPVHYVKNIVPQQNWNAQWESSFEPIVVNDFVAIRAAFHKPVTAVKHEIIITPKMSFGTGHHATTFMMIQQMEALDFTGKKVVDYGTGTAVLAILAEKMGADSVNAIDYDEWSIENSIENAAANNCSRISLVKAETIAPVDTYDIILANINLNVILDNMDAIKAVSNEGGLILLSGFMKADEPVMLQSLEKAAIKQLKTIQKGDWICILAQAG